MTESNRRSPVWRTIRSLPFFACIVATGIVGLMPADVQAQATTSVIRGSVTDPGGEPVTGASITIVHLPTGSTTRVQSNAAGGFRATGLRVGGPYQVSLDAGGAYQSDQIDDIYLNLGETYPLTIVARPTEMEEVVATAQALDGGLKLGASSVFDSQSINETANIGRGFANIIRNDPRVTIDATNENAISIAGQNNRYNSLTIDGVRQNDDFGLNNNGLPTQRSPISVDALEQVSVEIAPFDVTYGGFTGGTINAVTKSGTNEFDGSLAFFKSDDSLTGDQIQDNDIDLGVFEEETLAVTFGGPIIKDRLWFFVSYEEFTATDTSAIDFGPAGSGRANVIDGISQAELDQIIDISRNVYGFDPLELPNSGTDVEDEKLMVKLDWAINDNHSLSATYQDVLGNALNTQGNFTFGGGGIGLPSNWYDRSEDFQALSFQLFSNWTDNFSTEVKIASQERVTGQNSLNGTDFADVDIFLPSGATVSLGPDRFRHANGLTNDQFQIKVKADYFVGAHQLTFGVERDQLDIFNIFVEGSEGRYEFDSIAEFQNRNASRLVYRNAVSNNKIDGGAGFEYEINTVYLQDTWEFDDRLTLQYGLRYDFYTGSDEPVFNQGFLDRNGFSNTETLDGRDVLMPRFGFTYLLNDRTTLRGGVGLFAGGSPNVWVSNSFSNDGITVVSVDNAGANDPACAGIESSPIALTNVNGFDIPQAIQNCLFPGAGDVNAIDPDFEIPSTWRTNLAIERDFDLGFLGDNWFVTGEVILSRVNKAVNWLETRRTRAGSAPDGRPIYDTPPNHDLILTNAEDGSSEVFTLSLQKTWDTERWGTFDAFAAYTFTDVDEVNSAQSSTASSNYGRQAIFDRQNRGVTTSDFEIKERFNGNLTWRKAFWGDNFTTISLFYEHRTGHPFSYTMRERPFDTAVFGGDADFARRDSQLLYIPAANDPNVIFSTSSGALVNDPAVQADFDAFIAAAGLENRRGTIVPRNLYTTKNPTRVDIRITQEIGLTNLPGVGDTKLELYLDIENLGNLLNSDWGRLEQVSFPFTATTVDVSINANGQYVYSGFDLDDALNPQNVFTLPSLYKIQLGAKLRF